MEKVTMPKMTVSLKKEEMKKFKELSDLERRAYGQEIMFLVDFYLKNKDKVK